MKCTQQDVVVLTVLCNLVVLAGLLATANQIGPVRVEEERGFAPQKIYTKSHVQEGPSAQMQAVSFDEIDRLLEDYIPTEEQEEPQVARAVAQKKKISKQKGLYYTVQSGDNPWKIAKKFHISYEKLLELNQLDEAKARNLKIGQKLCIEGAP